MNKFILFLLISLFFISKESQAQSKRWYSYAQYLKNNTLAVDSFDINIWSNDTGIICDLSGGSPYYYTCYYNSVGMSFAPVLSNWDDITQYGSTIKVQPVDAYIVDSVRVHGAYRRNPLRTATVDTLILSFVYGDGNNSTNLQERTITSGPGYDIMSLYGYDTLHILSMAYDSIKNVAKNFTGVATPAYIQKVLLYAADTALNFDRSVVLTTPLSVPAGYCAAVGLSFKSGDPTYYLGDTVEYATGGYKYGSFLPAILYAGDATSADFAHYDPIDSNVGYFIQGRLYDPKFPEQYGPTFEWWGGPGTAAVIQYPEIDFHISCATCSANDTIAGTKHVCLGSTTDLSYSPGGGTWSSNSAGIASVSPSGVVTGVSLGTATISYFFSGHYATTTVTVDSPPTAGSIAGPLAVCITDSILLVDLTAGGVWSSSVPAVATVNASTGWVTGISGGITGISYTNSNACGSVSVVQVITVNTLSAGSVSGTPTLCTGAFYTFTDGTGGGVWSSSSTGVAIVGSTGVVTGIGTGTATISYTVSNACGTAYASAVVSVNVSPAVNPISGTMTVCSGLTTSLTDATPIGAWSSTSTGIATISTAGTVTGVTGGTATISYTITTACGAAAATAIVTVTTTPVAGGISGPSAVCIGSSITLTDASPGGTWTSGSTGIATIGSTTGFVTGIAAGTARITYTISNSCGTATTTTNIAVSTAPSAGTITGATNLCVTTSTTLSDLVTGGTWNATNGHAFISSTGTVLGVTAGVDTMIYTVTSTCATTSTAIATLVLTVNPAPDAGSITGPDSVCITHSITLSDAISGGTWTASNSNAFVSSTGVVLGVTIGTDNVTYTTTNFCGSASAEALITISDCTTGTINLPINEYTLYPNPAQNNITITASTNIEKVLISNIFGQEVFVGKYNSQNIMINIDRLIAGVYLIKINDAKVYKLIKQ